MEKQEKYMRAALKMADKSESLDEVPVGCVIVKNDVVIARGFNTRETKHNPLGHAEIMAISKASKKLGDWQLVDCDLYVTLEPCLMCAGAIIQSRIKNVYFGAYDPKGGAFGSSIDVLKTTNINHKPLIHSGILQEECSKKITNYFKTKRQNKLGL